MVDANLDALPPHHRESLSAAFVAAFGHVRIGRVAPLGGGASGAFPYRIEIGGRSYLVRIEGPASPLRNPYQYAAMRHAAEAGLAPRLHHVDEAARVAVLDFVAEQPLSTFPGGPDALAEAVGRLLRRLQGLASFPAFVRYDDMVGRLWRWVCGTGLFAEGVLDAATDRFLHLCATYPWDLTNPVASHNDPVPRNILFDGQRLWLIDWESAYRNDPLVDVGIAMDGFAPIADRANAVLLGWLGRPPDDAALARLEAARALAHLYYAGVFFSAAATGLGARGLSDLTAPDRAEMIRMWQSGSVSAEAPQTKLILGKMYLAAFQTGVAPPSLGASR